MPSEEAKFRAKERCRLWHKNNRDKINARNRLKPRIRSESQKAKDVNLILRKRANFSPKERRQYLNIKIRSQRAMLAKRYKIPLIVMDEYDAYGCYVCGALQDTTIDHNHITGLFRGILCRRHNLTLGYANDNINVLKQLINYLKNPYVAC